MHLSDIGIYGLGVMGGNLTLNFVNNGFNVSVCNRKSKREIESFSDLIANCPNKDKILIFKEIENFVLSLSTPRKIILMVKSGELIDDLINQLIAVIDSGDVIIDCGNSKYCDTNNRYIHLKKSRIHYLGCGVSGGWRGALNGPSIMVGGSFEGWELVKDMFYKISAEDKNKEPCCDWLGPEGAGHFVKMIHNGIEYALMQSISEAYDVMRNVLYFSNLEISNIFSEWGKGDLKGYLMNVSEKVLLIRKDKEHLIDFVLDRSKQKGTGKDFVFCALEYGISTPTITEAVNSRFISNSKHRGLFNKNSKPSGKKLNPKLDSVDQISLLHDAVYCSWVSAVVQGIDLLQTVSDKNSWNIDVNKVFSIWKNGCVIQSGLLDNLGLSIQKHGLGPAFIKELSGKKESLNQSIVLSSEFNIPMPTILSSFSYYTSLSANSLPANLIQLQREYFGSHGYEVYNNPGVIQHFEKDDEDY